MHFDEFMDEVHAGDRRLPQARGQAECRPVAAVTKPLLETTRLLCLDEFQVTDITNAMLLGRLFEKLFAGGRDAGRHLQHARPDELYRDGLNRQLFLPFIALLKRMWRSSPLDGPTDYRRLKFAGEEVYQFGTGPEVDAAMDRLWLKLTGGAPGEPDDRHSLGRDIPVPQAAMGAARFPFAALCEKPARRAGLSAARACLRDADDRQCAAVRAGTNPSAAKRFILLVDTLYDRGIKLAASFAVPLDDLVAGSRNAGEFQRTLSRLVEMQSAAYLRGRPQAGSRAALTDQSLTC